MTEFNPALEWYIGVSQQRGVAPRCPFATVESCPRYYQSLSLLGGAGSTEINPKKDKKLLKRWRRSDLWPQTREQDTGISSVGGEARGYSNFCPEVSFERFNYFASYLHRYSAEIDRDMAHQHLSSIGAARHDWRWVWSTVLPTHYAECALYSVLCAREQANATNALGVPQHSIPVLWDKYGRTILIGLFVAVVGGLMLAALVK